MLFRRQTIHARLVTSFAGIVSVLLAIALVAALFWLVGFQRETLRDNMQAYASIIAARTETTPTRTDTDQLTKDLESLVSSRSVRWALVTQGKQVRAEIGPLPPELHTLRTDPTAALTLAHATGNIVVVRAISYPQGEPGAILIGADLASIQLQFAAIALGGVSLLLALFLVALPVFHRLVRTVSDPLQQLARMSQLKSSFRSGDDTEAATRVGAGRTTTAKTTALQGGRANYALFAVADGDTPSVGDAAPTEVERLGMSFDRMLSSIAERDAQMRQSRDELRALNASLQAVRETERTRIAHEIHDELGQRLTAIKLDVARVVPPATTDGAHLAKMIDETVKVVREISWELRPSVLDALGLTAAIEWLGEDFQRRMATRCKVSVPEPPPQIDAEAATQLFRICQELLTNIARHAAAGRVDIKLTAGDELRLEVRDDGVGIKPRGLEQKSLGLLGIRERVHALGGKLQIETVPQIAGTKVCVIVPNRTVAATTAGAQK